VWEQHLEKKRERQRERRAAKEAAASGASDGASASTATVSESEEDSSTEAVPATKSKGSLFSLPGSYWRDSVPTKQAHPSYRAERPKVPKWAARATSAMTPSSRGLHNSMRTRMLGKRAERSVALLLLRPAARTPGAA